MANIIVSVNDFTDESDPIVKYRYNVYSGKADEFHICIMNADATAYFANYREIPVMDIGSYEFELTDTERTALRQAAANIDGGKLKVRFRLATQHNPTSSNQYSECLATMTVVNATPSIVFSIEDNDTEIRQITGGQDSSTGLPILVLGYSDMKVTVTPTAKKGRTISTFSVSNSGNTIEQTYNPSASNYVVFENIQADNLSIKVTDSAGGYNEINTTVDVLPYTPITCNIEVSDTVHNESNNTTTTYFSVSGTYYNKNIGKTSNNIRASYRYCINKGTWTSWTSSTVTKTTNGYNLAPIVITAPYRATIDLEVNISDVLSSSIKEYSAQTIPIYDWSETDFNFNVDVEIQEDLRVHGTVFLGTNSLIYIAQQGSSNGWNYRLWSNGDAECWRTLTIDDIDIDSSTSGGWHASGNLSQTNLSFPFTFKERPAVTVTTMPTGTSWAIIFPGSTTGSTTQTGSYQLLGTSETYSKSYILSYQVKGKWK